MSAGRNRLGSALIAWELASPAARFAVGRSLMTSLVTDLVDQADVEIFRHCPRCGSHEHGAPQIRDLPIAVSVSYAGSMVAAAAIRTTDAAAIGIDIEPEASAARVGELALLFQPLPAPDLRQWTLLEAVLKADGRGLNVDPSTVVLGGSSRTVLGRARMAAIPGRAEPVAAAAVDGPSGFVVSVAVAGAAPEAAVRSATR
jgi:4'-phosphopantetheinyl transferase